MWEVLAVVLITISIALGTGGVVLCIAILFADIPRQKSER